MNYNYIEKLPSKKMVGVNFTEDDETIFNFDDGSSLKVKIIEYSPSMSEILKEEIDKEIISELLEITKKGKKYE